MLRTGLDILGGPLWVFIMELVKGWLRMWITWDGWRAMAGLYCFSYRCRIGAAVDEQPMQRNGSLR